MSEAKIDEASQIDEKKLKELEEMAKKLKEPIFLKSPMNYRGGEVVITELSDAERDQMLFTFLARSCSFLENMFITLNDILLLQHAIGKKQGIDTDKVVNNCMVEFGETDKNIKE